MKRGRSKRGPRDTNSPTEELDLTDRIRCGRTLALYAIQQHDHTGRFLSEVLRQSDDLHGLATRERAFAVDLSAGVIRRRRTIDTLLESQISRPRANVEADLWRVLQLGVQQVAFSGTPDHAAVGATVELCRQVGRPRWAGFVNGVLRNIRRLISEDLTDSAAADALPVQDGRFVRLQQPVLPDPQTEPIEYHGQAFSLSRALSRRWFERLPIERLQQMSFFLLQPPAIHLRVNRRVTTAAAVLDAFTQAGIAAESGERDFSIRLTDGVRIESLPGYADGWWSVQDPAAMEAASLLNPKVGERVLDLCAAPGGKTTHLAELSDDQAAIVACDVLAGRLRRVDENADRLQLRKIETKLIGKQGEDLPDGEFDAVLADVPCSNTGVLGRRPEARWRFQEHELADLVQLQTRLLATAIERTRPGGRIVYSTCSIEPEENEGVVQAVLAGRPDLKLIREVQLLPGEIGDGAYCALLSRNP